MVFSKYFLENMWSCARNISKFVGVKKKIALEFLGLFVEFFVKSVVMHEMYQNLLSVKNFRWKFLVFSKYFLENMWSCAKYIKICWRKKNCVEISWSIRWSFCKICSHARSVSKFFVGKELSLKIFGLFLVFLKPGAMLEMYQKF